MESGPAASTTDPTDDDAFSALFYEHVRSVEAYVVAHHPTADADDIVNETFAIAWRRWDDIPRGSERPWLIGVARNLIHNTRRSARRRGAFLDALIASRPAVSTELGGGRLLDEDLEPVRQAFAELSPHDREILLLAAWEDLRGSELGQVLGLTPNQAATRLSRARHRLRARTTDASEAS